MDDRERRDGPDEEAGGGLVAVPGFLRGGRVDRTGIALVQQGEYDLPAPGSEARGAPGVEEPGGQVINYHFPITIEVVGTLDAGQLRQVTDHVLEELADALERRG